MTRPSSGFGQDENEIAHPCAGDLLDGHVNAARFEAVARKGGTSPPLEEGGITQDARGVFWLEGLRDVPSQGAEARFRFNTNCNICEYIIQESTRKDHVPANSLIRPPVGLPSRSWRFTRMRSEVSSGIREGRCERESQSECSK